MENVLRKRIILKNNGETTQADTLKVKQGELLIDYNSANKPSIKVGPKKIKEEDTKPKEAISAYAKCAEISNTNGVRIAEEGDSTFGGMVSNQDGIDAKKKSLDDLGTVTFAKGLSYGSSFPSQSSEGQVFFLITDSTTASGD